MPAKVKPAGLEVVDPPPRSNGRPRLYSAERLAAIARQARSGNWLSDRQPYPTRAAANWRAEALIGGLLEHVDFELERRTWKERDGEFFWAVRKKGES